MASYSIRDLEKLSGIKAHTLRIWEKRYSLVEPKRTQTNIRFYDDDDLKKIMNIAFLNRSGFKISHIAQLNTAEIKTQISELSRKHTDTELHIDNLILSMINLDERKFEKITNNSIMQVGFEDTILHTIYPFLEKVGILWQTGTVIPAQEHFVSNLVRQKLIVAIDGVIEPDNPKARNFLLFLPEGELHEMGLLFYHYLIKKSGHKAVYLGQSVPFSDLEIVLNTTQCDSLLTSFVTNRSESAINEYLKKLSSTYPDHAIYFSSYKEAEPKKLQFKNVRRVSDAIHFRDILREIS
jgi:MerR family transcriptional regulator, light-induced transcriptional regulator